MNSQNKTKKKRPLWVWVISLFYIFSGTMTFLTIYRIHFGMMPDSTQLEELKHASILWSMYGLIPALNIAGGLLLVMRHRLSLYIFSGIILLNVINLLRHAAFTDIATQLNSGSIWGMIIGLGLPLIVCVYTCRLNNQEKLKKIKYA